MEALRYIFVVLCCLASVGRGTRISYTGQNLKKMGVIMNMKYEFIKKKLEMEDAQFKKKAAIAKAYEEGIKAALAAKKEPPAPLPRNYYENVGFPLPPPVQPMQPPVPSVKPAPPVHAKKAAPLFPVLRNRIETRQASHVQSEKRSMIEKLNYAALHRNVMYDSVGGDPYGGPSPVLSNSDFIFPKGRRKRSLIKKH